MGRHTGEFEYLLLWALLRLEDEAYGGRIRREIEDRTGRMVSPGAVYTALDRLECRGMVTSWLGDPTPQRGGKRKRYYKIQPAGVAEIRSMHEIFGRMSRGLEPKLETS